MTELKPILTSPFTALSAVATVIVGYLGFLDPVLSLVASTADMWFPIIAVFATNVAPLIGWISADEAQKLLLVAALLFIAVYAGRLFDRVEERFDL